MKKTSVALILSGSSGSCEVGPIFIKKPGQLDVWYDAEEKEGSTEWFRITFQSVIAFRFCPEIAVDEMMVTAYGRILELEDSDWLASLSSLASQRHQQLLPKLRHLVLFFDHHGCLEVVAKSASEERTGGPAIHV